MDDAALTTRFGSATAQRTLMTVIARAFQPSAAHGFTGTVAFELRPAGGALDVAPSDWWTIEVSGGRARARPGGDPSAALTMHLSLPDFVRLGAGEIHPVEVIFDGRARVSGDPLLATRLGDMFGIIDRSDLDLAP